MDYILLHGASYSWTRSNSCSISILCCIGCNYQTRFLYQLMVLVLMIVVGFFTLSKSFLSSFWCSKTN